MRKSKTNYNILNDCRGLYEEEIYKTILAQRGIENPEEFLNPTEDSLLPLDALKNIDKAYNRLMQAVDNEENIGVLFDTDTDGITSGTIMTRYLKYLVDYDIHTFIDEGKQHGLMGQDLRPYYCLDLLIIVDSLDKDIEQYKELSENGVDIIVLDHHAINPEVPYDDYCILVSSQRDYPNPQLSGAGVVWKFCKYMDSKFLTNDADKLVDLAACGLVADMMDMRVMENRYIVNQGLHNMKNPAIKKIIGSFDFNSTAISFSIAPMVNASNRMNENDVAMQAFLADDNKEVLACMKILKKCREQQNEEVDRLLPSVIEQCENQIQQKMITVFIDTIYGISGLLGNKLLEKYQRPILVLKSKDDYYMGSMRAVGVDDFRSICNESGLAQADGHELASGITIRKDDFEKFADYINQNLTIQTEAVPTDVDIQIEVSDITRKLIDFIKRIDFVSGTNFKPVKAYINGIAEYEIGQMSDYKHLVVQPNDYLKVIKWNFDGSFEDMEDASMMNEELEVICTLDSGFLGRNFVLKAICDEISEVC